MPRVLQTRKGALSDLVKCLDNAEHIVHILTYLPGIVTSDAEQTPVLWKNKGKILDTAFTALNLQDRGEN